MKILLYNWLPFDDEKGRGGGVSVYLRNLVEKMCEKPEFDVWFLSSGYYYDIHDSRVRYECIDNVFSGSCQSYTIINSPIISPGRFSFFYIDRVLEDSILGDLFERFINEFGPFNVVHYHNLEGISLSVLRKHAIFHDTMFLYTIHNYYAFCPQVNLWKQERENCTWNNTGKECLYCMREHVPFDKLAKKKTYEYELRKCYSETLYNEYQEKEPEINSEYYEEEHRDLYEEEKYRIEESLSVFRSAMVETINSTFDYVLGVSKRTCNIASKMGIDHNKILLSYIGTKYAENIICRKEVVKKEYISLIFMGYQRKDKGYEFFVKAMNLLPREISKKINLTIAAKNMPDMESVKVEVDRFASYSFYDGYKREDIEKLLQNQDLGVIPVLWEDNLPQVAIEMVAKGVPVLTSDRGGASELSEKADFVFKAGDLDDFINHIVHFVRNPCIINEYWDGFKKLTTMEEHINQLESIYYGVVK